MVYQSPLLAERRKGCRRVSFCSETRGAETKGRGMQRPGFLLQPFLSRPGRHQPIKWIHEKKQKPAKKMEEILNILFFGPNFLDFRSVMFLFFWVVPYLVVWLELIHSLASKNPWLAFRYYEMEISKSSLGAQICSSFVEHNHINPRNVI